MAGIGVVMMYDQRRSCAACFANGAAKRLALEQVEIEGRGKDEDLAGIASGNCGR